MSSTVMTNGATTLLFREGDLQIPLKSPKRKFQRRINNSVKLPVIQTISDATDQLLTVELILFRADQGTYAGADSLISFYESSDPSGINMMAQSFMLTDSDGDSYQCRFVDDLRGGLREIKKDSHFAGSVRLLVEHTLPTDEDTGPILWLAAYDMDNNGGDLAAWSQSDPVGNTDAEWEDKSGNDNDGLQSSSPGRPIFSEGIINSRPANAFDGLAFFLEVDGIAASFDGLSDTAWSMYAIIDGDDTNSDETILGVGDSSAATDIIDFVEQQQAGGGPGNFGAEIHDGAAAATTTCGVTDTSPHVLSIICAGTTVSTWLDGASKISAGAFNKGQIDVDKGRVGCQIIADTEGEFFDGRIGELVLFTGAHSTLQRRRQEYRLSDMWGHSLTA